MREVTLEELKTEAKRFFPLDVRDMHIRRENQEGNAAMIMSGLPGSGLNFCIKHELLLCLLQKSKIIEIDTENEHLALAETFSNVAKVCFIRISGCDTSWTIPDDFDYLHISLYYVPSSEQHKVSRKVLSSLWEQLKNRNDNEKIWLFHTELSLHMTHNDLPHDATVDDIMENAFRYNVIPTFALIDLEDFDEETQRWCESLSYAVILAQTCLTRTILKDRFGYSQKLLDCITNSEPGQGIMVCEGKRQEIYYHSDTTTMLYLLATSKSSELVIKKG